MKNKPSFTVLIFLVAFNLLNAQNTVNLTDDDYRHAASMLSGNLSKYIDNDIHPQWLPDGRLWYRSLEGNNVDYRMFNPADKKRSSAASTTELFGDMSAGQRSFRRAAGEVLSPDGKYAAFIRDWNLWIRDFATGAERPLTTDGIENFGYATDNAGWKRSNKPILSWSPDSKKIATFRQDQRYVSNMYLVRTKIGAPELVEWKYPLRRAARRPGAPGTT